MWCLQRIFMQKCCCLVNVLGTVVTCHTTILVETINSMDVVVKEEIETY
jgi:hypothetical protein